MNLDNKVVIVTGASEWIGKQIALKHWVRGFTDVLKEDLKETNVRVAGVYQAGTNTSMFANTGETMPIEKFTDPADLENVIEFMLSQPPKIWLHDVRVQF